MPGSTCSRRSTSSTSESLNDQVAELTGIRVRETIPDAVLGRADEIVVVDLTPEALLERLRAGKVYPPERIDAGAEQLLPDREPRPPCARSRCARWPRRSAKAARAAAVGSREETSSPTRRRP